MLPTNSGQGYQEFICGSHGQESTLANAMSQCEAFGLHPSEAAAEVMVVIAVVNDWQKHFALAGVSERDLQSLAERIDAGELLGQRDSFDPGAFQSAPRKQKKLGPFRRS